MGKGNEGKMGKCAILKLLRIFPVLFNTLFFLSVRYAILVHMKQNDVGELSMKPRRHVGGIPNANRQ